MVFPTEGPTEPREDGKPRRTWQEMLKKYNAAGLETFAYYSIQKDEVYIKIRCGLDRLMQQADLVNYKMELDPAILSEVAAKGFPKFGISPLKLNDDPKYCKYKPYEYIYAKFDQDPDLVVLYKKAPGLNHPFSMTHRIKLMFLIIEGPKEQAGCGINVAKCIEVGDVLQFFPLHDPKAAKILEKAYCAHQLPSSQPNDMFKDYFGEKVALFYVFLCHYTTWCAYLAVAGFGVVLDVLIEWRVDTLPVEFFAIFVAVWAVLLMEFWKQKEATQAMRWGMSDFESEEQDRPEFKGEIIASCVDGSDITYYPESKRVCSQIIAMFVTFFMILLVMAFIGTVFWLKSLPGLWPDYASLINSVGIQIFNAVYNMIAVKLTDNENYRTDTQYEDSLIFKLFGFQFVNSFASLYYIAFIQWYIFGTPCELGSCLGDLCENVGIIFVTNLVVQNMTSIYLPRVMAAINKYKEGGSDALMSVPELQYLMMPFDPQLDNIDAYMTLARQFGYMVLFVVAFPAAPVLAYVSNYAQIRMDAFKFLNTYQRILPGGAQDIGTWQTVMTAISGAAVITNAALCVFVMNTFSSVEMGNLTYFKCWMFIIFQYFLFGLMVIFSIVVADCPYDVEIQLQRQAFINEKVISKVADDDDSVTVDADEVVIHAKEKDEGVYFKTIEELFMVAS
jgi:hypothetical protein